MPTSADRPAGWAVDTSVAVASLDEAHAAHVPCLQAVAERSPALAGHAAFECYSVLTRLPGAAQVSGTDAAAALRAAFPGSCWLAADEQADLLDRIGPMGVLGGAVYDALVGEAARVRGRTLLTRDRRAVRTYDLIGVHYELVE
ncbi:MAG: type II toxin-antitoxin system VapC family toxin [Acidimicrobiia bacterium]|nr:type II toxin-antitoxin system VapC family toxin [Acidimicrobiia bacterium]